MDIPRPAPANGVSLPDAATVRTAFDRAPRYTVGLEDEVMVLDQESLELVPRAPHVLERLSGEEEFKLELPASQLEILTPVSVDLSQIGGALLQSRRRAAHAAQGVATLAAAGVHPFSHGMGELNQLPRYAHTVSEYGPLASRQLVCALQVHVAVGDAARALAVYNAARSYLPLVAALAANAPLYQGRDSGLASVRPKLSGLLPRQGVPPPLESWEELAEAFRWGAAAGTFPEPRTWWWELRPHVAYGTLEFRVPDAQSTVAEAISIAAVVQSLVVWLDRRHADGEPLDVAASWRIEENRWSACRYGVSGTMADLRTGARTATSELLHELLDELAPVAQTLGNADPLREARRLIENNGALSQRRVFAADGAVGVARWLTARFLRPDTG